MIQVQYSDHPRNVFLRGLKIKELSKPRRDGQGRWREPGWAARTRRCLSGRFARSGTRCGRAAGSASGSWGKTRWQGCPPRAEPGWKNSDLPPCWKCAGACDVALWRNCLFNISQILTARMKRLSVAAGKISFSRVTFLRGDIEMNLKQRAVTQRLHAAVSEKMLYPWIDNNTVITIVTA